MTGGYDLYGNYYPNRMDAENAEMAQCAFIGMQYSQRDHQELANENYELLHRINNLESQVAELLKIIERLEKEFKE